ncbi:sigma-B regulation protein RsbU (phosphoserine phosphatase) [Sphingobium xenophagum]|uniref:Sigma-B regulation protein RsbU (Phosphoserine phosphatase) n=1 Tax=Sphingobium xenophagum TaxID=121428 RepID=A0ABU1X2M5_SPHXE|nr:SpoIIE family protein phosphatase [Sphingobium xenophagum]MDR7155828.1 sigma-B regulation protein RsbU (phosphoserine phosphatase) [Sphingobium xenophagum]
MISSGSRHSERPLNVLLVDDDDLFLEYLTWELETLNCTAQCAMDAEKALTLLQDNVFDMVVTDWQMPGMDGIALVERIRALHGRDRFLHVVMTTARGDSQTIRHALNAGVDDFLFKPLDRIQLELAMASARRNVALHYRLQRRNHHLAAANARTREAYRRVQADLDAAAALHRRLLPDQDSHGPLQVAWTYRPAQHISGDTIGLIPLRNGAHLFFLADVQGHGVPAALASFHIHHRLSQLAPDTPAALSQAISDLNREIEGQQSESYATLICGLLFPQSGESWIICAGHPPPFIMHLEDVAPLVLEGTFPLGWFPDANFDPMPFQLRPGDRLILYSDGVTECCDTQGTMLEQSGLRALLDAARSYPIDQMVQQVDAALRTRRGPAGLEDDISLLALEISTNQIQGTA